MDPSLKHKIRSSLLVVIFIIFIIGFIRPWLHLGFYKVGRYIYITDPLVNPANLAKFFHELNISKGDSNALLGMIIASSFLYLITTFSILGGFKDIRSLIVSGGLGIASGLIWMIMYNYLVNILTEPSLGLASLFIDITIWPYAAIGLGALEIILYIFMKD